MLNRGAQKIVQNCLTIFYVNSCNVLVRMHNTLNVRNFH